MFFSMSDEKRTSVWEKRFKETADLLPGIICEGDKSLRVTYANEFAFKAFRYDKEDVRQGVNFSDLLHPDDKERASENVARLLAGESVGPQEYRLVHKDGSMSDYQINSVPIRDGGAVVGIRTCIFDISERKRAAEELKASEERFRRIFHESPIGIALFDAEGGLLDGNRAFRAMFRLPEGTVTKRLDPLFVLVPFDADGRERLEGGRIARYTGAFELVPGNETGEGTERRYLEWSISRLVFKEGDADVLLAQVQDITERWKAEEARLEEARLATEKARALVKSLKEEVRGSFTFSNMVSRSPEMKKIFDILPQIAVTPTTVLISGESGTGKELIARALHQLSPRKRKPFVAINCSALPDNLLESELFGYKAGAFTDAKRDKPGKFALAEGGVLFLDEIGDISPAMQVKLLRVLQERTYEPLGAVKSVKADVRIVAATHRNLQEMVAAGAFREDLFYRMNVLKIRLPPLRDRRMDIPLLVDHFIQRFNRRYDRAIEGISPAALDRLMVHDFNGNVRELENVVEHAFVFCTEGELQTGHLPEEIGDTSEEDYARALRGVASLEELEAHYLRAILDETGGSRIEAARRLGIHKSTLFRKLKKLGISD
jgi:PAS domain S-box-containing protein